MGCCRWKLGVCLLIVLVIVLTLVAVVTSVAAETGVYQVDGIPSSAIQILYNGDFEGMPPYDGWTFSDQYSCIVEPGFLSDYALGQGFSYESGITVATHHLDGIDFSNYDEPIWLKRCHRILTWELTPGIEYDVGEGSFYTDYGMSVAYLWKLSNLDDTSGWLGSNCTTYEIHGLTAWGDRLDLVLAALNSEDSPTTFYYDNIEIWAVPRFKVFLPVVMGGM